MRIHLVNPSVSFGTSDFAKWEGTESARATVNGVPLSRSWLITSSERPKVYSPHPLMSPDDFRRRPQQVWNRFYSLAAIWQRRLAIRVIT